MDNANVIYRRVIKVFCNEHGIKEQDIELSQRLTFLGMCVISESISNSIGEVQVDVDEHYRSVPDNGKNLV